MRCDFKFTIQPQVINIIHIIVQKFCFVGNKITAFSTFNFTLIIAKNYTQI